MERQPAFGGPTGRQPAAAGGRLCCTLSRPDARRETKHPQMNPGAPGMNVGWQTAGVVDGARATRARPTKTKVFTVGDCPDTENGRNQAKAEAEQQRNMFA